MGKVTDRERLVKSIISEFSYTDIDFNHIKLITLFIENDRKRILKPLIDYKKRSKNKGWGYGETDKLIDITLTLAGVTNE